MRWRVIWRVAGHGIIIGEHDVAGRIAFEGVTCSRGPPGVEEPVPLVVSCQQLHEEPTGADWRGLVW